MEEPYILVSEETETSPRTREELQERVFYMRNAIFVDRLLHDMDEELWEDDVATRPSPEEMKKQVEQLEERLQAKSSSSSTHF